MGGSKLILYFVIVVLSSAAVVSCGEETTIKPAAKLRLDYPEPNYRMLKTACPFRFEYNSNSEVELDPNCNININYGQMKATLYLTYQPVSGANIEALLRDAQKLTYDHTVKANEIFEQPRMDTLNDVYGMFYMINGDAATQTQFYVTDSIKHFVSGSVYFETKPNFDSIYPGVVYLRDDVRRLMETIQWKDVD